MRNKIALLVSVFILFALCNSFAAATGNDSQNENSIRITSSISAVDKHFTQSIPPPKTAGKKAIAANIDISFPQLVCQTGESAAVDAVNSAIQSQLLKMLNGKNTATIEQLMETFGRDYTKAMKATPEMLGAWFLKFKATFSYYNDSLLCIKILQSVFIGGAHPDSYLTCLVFSLKTGELHDLSELIRKNSLDKLTKIAEKHFRQTRNMKPEDTYKKAGYWFENNQFSLNQNFLISKTGISFCFNQSEVAPYAKGIIELSIPWNDLKEIVDPKGPGGRFLQK